MPTLRGLNEIISRQQQTQSTLLDWLRVEYAIEKPSNKLLAATDLNSDTWVAEVKRIRGKKQPLSSTGLHALRDEHTRTIAPARALAAETLTLERTLSDLVNQAYALTRAEIELMWQTTPPRHASPAACNMNSPSSPATKRPEDGRWLPIRIRYVCRSLGLGTKRISTRFSNAAAMRRSMAKEWPS